jgi:two-component system chemotaxis sensor kinase CheA
VSIDLERFHRAFFDESFEGLDAMEQALLRPDIGSADAEAVNAIFRAAHSIKGGAATFGFTAVADFTHGVETLLDDMRSGRRAVGADSVDLLLRAADAIRALLTAARDAQPIDAAAVAVIRAEIERLLAANPLAATAPADYTPAVSVPAAPAPAAGWLLRFEPRAELFRSGNDPLRILRALQSLGELEVELDESCLPAFADADAESCYLAWNLRLRTRAVRAEIEEQFAWVADECILQISPIVEAPQEAAAVPAAAAKPELRLVRGGEPERAATSTGDGGSIRVATDKIDALINLVGELVITQAMLAQTAAELDPVMNEKLLAGLSQLDRNTRQLQEAVMSTRMLPIESVFSRFPRVVRDLAAKLGKQVSLSTVGEGTELDKSVIEKIADPLNHLVRNSLDHGIELPDARIAAGKNPVGSVTLKAAHEGGNIVVEVADDGHGLDRARILAKALQRGLAVSESISDAELWQLIFAPGFSTADQVTDVSGRGVGMDVVKKNIQALGGSVELHSVAGRGSRTVIRLPLTRAILDGMSVSVGGEVFIIPLGAIVESLQPLSEQVKSVSGQGRVVRVRNEYVPLLPLYELFGIRSEVREPHRGILVLLESEGRKLALQVDELVGQQQVVIKSLEANYRRVHCISGATILGDGRVALILDVAELVRAVSRAAAA